MTSENNTIIATSGNNVIFSGAGDDTIFLGTGYDFVNGGAGFDTVVYAGSIFDYNIQTFGFGHYNPTFVSRQGPDGHLLEMDFLVQVEAIRFEAENYTFFLDGRNNAVLAQDDVASVDENKDLTLSAADLLANDTDFDGDLITITSVSATSASGASVSLIDGNIAYSSGGLFDFLPDGESTTDTFTYTVDDGFGGTATATVTVTIAGSNDAPVFTSAAAVSVDENNANVTTLTATDADSASLSYSIIGGADAALFTLDAATGALSFVSAPDFEAPLDAGADNIYDIQVAANDGAGGVTQQAVAITVADVDETPVVNGRINELHYDNAGGDVGEFVEIRVDAGNDVSALKVELYNGSNSRRSPYDTVDVSTLTMTTDGTFDYYVWERPGIQNGAPDGVSLVNGTQVLEFLSYEGTFVAAGGAAIGLTSTDIGVRETGTTAVGFSLQRRADGSWEAPREDTRGLSNEPAPVIVINELAVNTAGTDWEFAELHGTPGASLDGFSLIQVSGVAGEAGKVLSVIDLAGQAIGDNGFFLASSAQADATFGVTGDVSFSNNTFTNRSSTFLLVEDFTGAKNDDIDIDDDGVLDVGAFGSVVDSVALSANDNPLTYSDAVLGSGASFVPAGAVRNPDGTGNFEMTDFGNSATYTPTSGGQTTSPDPTQRLISEIQGTGSASMIEGEYVIVSAIVTYTVSNGFYLQEEDSDADGDILTSEGIFVFTGSAPTVAVGDLVRVTGNVVEFFGQTQIGSVTDTIVESSGNLPPTAATIALDPSVTQNFEASEGMLVSVTTGIAEALTVIENFNFDRFGQITVSAGEQVQATQIFDAQTQAADVTATVEGNQNNRLLIDDGLSSQNPDSFAFVPANVGDNGNGILDSGDTFSDAGPTLRLGAQITEPITGVLNFSFGDYQVLADDVLAIDETTNGGARPDLAPDVGGSLKVASFNVLNYFTTLSGTTPLTGLGVRGARSVEDLQRQTDKIVDAMLDIGADVFGLQELENNGFGSTSAIQALVDALNAGATARGMAANYAFVDPTGGVGNGAIGTDAITNGMIYNTSEVSLRTSAIRVFDEVSAGTTFDLAAPLNAVVGAGDRLGDYQRSRPAVAATFEDIGTGEAFTVAVNHFKSKGDSNLQDLADAAQAALDGGNTTITQADIDALRNDPNFDQANGQAFWNQVRADAAAELTAWLEGEYSIQAGDPDYLIIGDLNAYSQEDPVQQIRDTDGYTDLIEQYIGLNDAFSFVFDGQRGALDHGLASSTLAGQITGATEWHINAQEPDLLNYNSRFNNPNFYSDDQYAASDHDPLIIGLELSSTTVLA